MGVVTEGVGLAGEMSHQQKGRLLRGGGLSNQVELTPMPAKVKLDRILPSEQPSMQGPPLLWGES